MDAGTMSPFEHGEVFVLDDGGEVRTQDEAYKGPNEKTCIFSLPSYRLQGDLDLGNYERFLDITLAKDNNITTGKIYQVSHDDDTLGMNMTITTCIKTHCSHIESSFVVILTSC